MADTWFHDAFGIEECEWDFKTLPKQVKDDAGSFQTYSIKELKENLPEKRGDNRPFKVYTRTGRTREDLFDTSALQASGVEKAMYQVASNFNCLEVGSERTNPFSGMFLTRLMCDTTQGPSAAGGAACGAALRLTIHDQDKINLLKDTPFKPINGKLRNLESMPDLDPELIRVGLHTDVRASYTRMYNKFEYDPNGPLIDQVYTSTCIVKNQPGEMVKTLLKAAYDGTYLCAVKRQSPRLVLTLIGGGCFGNPMSFIGEAISSAHMQFSPYLHPDCEVILPVYDGRSAKSVITSLANEFELVRVTS